MSDSVKKAQEDLTYWESGSCTPGEIAQEAPSHVCNLLEEISTRDTALAAAAAELGQLRAQASRAQALAFAIAAGDWAPGVDPLTQSQAAECAARIRSAMAGPASVPATPNPIPVTATGLAGRDATALKGSVWVDVGSTVTIKDDTPSATGQVECRSADGLAVSMHASSLELHYADDAPHRVTVRFAEEPAMGKRVRSALGSSWTHQVDGWHCIDGPISWDELNRNFGPLFLVWDDLDDIPEGASYLCSADMDGCRCTVSDEHPHIRSRATVTELGHRLRAAGPFTSTTPYWADVLPATNLGEPRA